MAVEKIDKTIEKTADGERSYEGIPPKVEKIVEELSCELNKVEWNNRANELADAHTATNNQEVRKKQVVSDLNDDVKAAKIKENKLANIVSSRREQREVTVEVKYDYESGIITKTRTDTNEIISSRQMTTSERQGSLFDGTTVDANTLIEERHEGEDDEEAEQTKESGVKTKKRT